MAVFVLHGAWHGAWCWRRVAKVLTQAGHQVFRTDADGVGERSHLLKSHVNLDTHILDVVNEMRWQELNNIVLVGHSYAGMVISGVAEKMEKSIASVVMLDAFFPETGEALVDLQPPQVRGLVQRPCEPVPGSRALASSGRSFRLPLSTSKLPGC